MKENKNSSQCTDDFTVPTRRTDSTVMEEHGMALINSSSISPVKAPSSSVAFIKRRRSSNVFLIFGV